MPSWTLEEYTIAIENGHFLKSVQQLLPDELNELKKSNNFNEPNRLDLLNESDEDDPNDPNDPDYDPKNESDQKKKGRTITISKTTTGNITTEGARKRTKGEKKMGIIKRRGKRGKKTTVQEENDEKEIEKELLKKRLMNKYYYAGGSVRWMFGCTQNELIEDIDQNIQKVSDMKNMSAALTGNKSKLAVNHLYMITADNHQFFISEYVARLLAEKCEKSFIIEACNSTLAKKNPTFDGWLFEADFLMQLRLVNQNNEKLTLINFQEPILTQIHLDVKFRYFFLDVKDIKDYKNDLKENVWLIPNRWNQGCYDAVQLTKNGVRVFQVTRAKSHSLKLQYIVQLLDILVEACYIFDSIEIAFIIPDDFDSFKIKIPLGNLGNYEKYLKQTDVIEFFIYGLKRTNLLY
eukprot:TRINITY_DN14560_c0_g4_i3.p1 TRINITY_DN14560_c0_g4~~TRINITY_DN14560_c0_g4_i3.p1  ORF type:complete len:406 (+),score=106.18 TRINITY_DN14560_c0_g4_i3:669-1886(+)